MNKENLRNQNRQWTASGAGGFVGLKIAFCAVVGLAALGSARAGTAQEQQDKDSAGVTFSKQATAKEVGVPVYPGAKPHKDEKDDSSSVNMGLWGGSFGFKLAVMKMESNDAPEKIAEFYKKAWRSTERF